MFCEFLCLERSRYIISINISQYSIWMTATINPIGNTVIVPITNILANNICSSLLFPLYVHSLPFLMHDAIVQVQSYKTKGSHGLNFIAFIWMLEYSATSSLGAMWQFSLLKILYFKWGKMEVICTVARKTNILISIFSILFEKSWINFSS